MITIKDVAEKAGVSVATVSRVLNETNNVRQSTRERVMAVIEQLGYKPNAIARSLSNRKSNIIALVVPTITNPFFPELARAVEDIAESKGYQVILCNTDDSREKLLKYIDSLSTQYIDGMVIDSHNLRQEDIEQLKKNDIPVVLIDRIIHDGEFTSIAVDNRAGGAMATTHLLEIGCKRIGHLSGPMEVETALQRAWGYRDVVGRLSWFDQSWVAAGEYSVESGYQMMKELLMRHPDVDGIFASNDLIGIGALKAAYEWGKKVPNELSIIGFDGIDLSGLVIPPLTTVQQPIYQIGEVAVQELFLSMKDPNRPPKKHVLDVKLAIRESTLRSK